MADFEEDRGYTNRRSRNLKEKTRRDQFNILLTELGNVLELMDSSGNSTGQDSLSGRNRGKVEKTTILESTISYLKRQQNKENASARASNVDEFHEWKPPFVSNDAFM